MALGINKNVEDTDIDLKAIAKKLHIQFDHPTSDKLIKLLKNGGYNVKKLAKEVKEVTEKCLICIKRQKPPLRPIVCMPMASKFNECVAIDLKAWNKKYFLVMVDIATRFCQATVINNKMPSTIIRGLFKCWIALFGAPDKLLSDNGGEFNNHEVRALGEAFNIKIMTTAAESPWSNGICERLNAEIGERVCRIFNEAKCDLELALAWAVSARNALSNKSGYSPNQLVFGFNPAIPDVFNSKLPALEPVTSSEIVRENLTAMHLARRDFIRYESDEKIKRALKHNTRPSRVENLSAGDNIFYKRNDSDEWHGPGVVIGIDNKVVIVKHGGYILRVHTARLVRAPIGMDDTTQSENPIDVTQKINQEEAISSPDVSFSDEIPSVSSSEECDTNLSDEVASGSLDERESGSLDETNSEVVSVTGETHGNRDSERLGESDGEFPRADNHEQSNNSGGEVTRTWKTGERFSGVDSVTGEYVTGRILGRAGKVKGSNRDCYNIVRDNGWRGWYNLKHIKDLSAIPDDKEVTVLFSSNVVDQAKEKEIQNWRINDVYEEVEDRGQRVISVRWVVTEKVIDGMTKIKARLVARGFEENTESLRKDSPTCSKETVRILLSLASLKSWDCHTVDVRSAYLQGNRIDREVYLKPPREFYNGKLWKLNKTVYGLCDAARAWYIRVKTELLNLGAKRCSLDSSLFMWYRDGHLEGIVSIYVDDFLYAGSTEFNKSVIEKLKSKFLIGSSASQSFKYVGLNIESTSEGILVDQLQYAKGLQPICVSRVRAMNKGSELSEEEKAEYRAILGQLNWIATNTRPDIAFDVCELSVSLKEATMTDLLRLNKVVERVTKDSVKVSFPKIQSLESCQLECYTDAAFGNLPNSGSQGGIIIFLKDELGQKCPIFWQSRKLKRVIQSTLAAETLALVEGAETSFYIASILKEVTKIKEMKIHCYVDSKSLVDALSSSKQVDNRRLRIDIAVLDDMLEKKELSTVSWIDTKNQLADCLTKRGASTEKLRAAVYKELC